MNPLGLARRLRRDLIAAGPPRRGIPRGEEGTTRNSCTSGSGGVGIRLDDSSGGQHHRGAELVTTKRAVLQVRMSADYVAKHPGQPL